MNVVLKLADRDDARVIKNLWPLYQHDVSQFDAGFVPNRHGLFNPDDGVASWKRHTDEAIAGWWGAPESLFPYLILADGRPAGFNLVAARPALSGAIDADFVVHEFFVLHPFRGKGVAEQAAIEGFNGRPGKWEVVTWPTHARAIAFWRRVINGYTSGEYTEAEVDHAWGRRVAFRFTNPES
ncbi:hypothetical protein [Botrimarina sp.]|uniref:hypothetical protein n=1 Tax=Botrimarina sp. TaxID=2795802 RepID=UPI0032EE3C8F